ncbi:hypothetical protein [Teredinibacter purpureus]|uniref:hypothetical protein n=1 Tax=Teredinibacter purpureus TaxID=2731756 RepID=UPI0013C4A0F0|nr:hypothetical protein [Teredinibacter purpureus]
MNKALIILLLFFPVGCFSASCTNLPFYGYTDYEGEEYAFYASHKDLEGVPTWGSDSEEPPLSVGKATKIANLWASKNKIQLSLFSVMFMQRECVSLKGHWVYLFMYQSEEPSHNKEDGFVMVGVLQNGALLLPEKTHVTKNS